MFNKLWFNWHCLAKTRKLVVHLLDWNWELNFSASEIQLKWLLLKNEKLILKWNLQINFIRGEFRKKNRWFKDIRQIGEGGSSSNQKFKIILISDIFRRGGGALSLCQNFDPCNFYIFFESHINILSFVIRILRTFLCNYYQVLSLCEFLSKKMESEESLPIKERITMKKYKNLSYKICTKNLFLSKLG